MYYLRYHQAGVQNSVTCSKAVKNDLTDLRLSVKKVMLDQTPSLQYTWYDKDNEKVGEFKVWNWWDGKNMSDFEISKQYRGQGLSYKFLDYATKKLGVKNLSVAKDNDIAKHIYDKYGFKVTEQDNNYYYMSLDDKNISETM